MKRTLLGIVLLVLACSSANAALISRLSGQAYWDDVLNITWLADANLADTNSFGVAGINPDGSMNWNTADSWIAAVNATSYLGVNTWRLPTVAPLNGIGFVIVGVNYDGSTDGQSYNVGAPGSAYPGSTASEMAHLFYTTLGNIGGTYVNGDGTGCALPPYPHCLTNDGPFSNFVASRYWSGTAGPSGFEGATRFYFEFNRGYQAIVPTQYTNAMHAWAVSSGDPLAATVPIPAAVWLLGSALGMLGVLKRRRATA